MALCCNTTPNRSWRRLSYNKAHIADFNHQATLKPIYYFLQQRSDPFSSSFLKRAADIRQPFFLNRLHCSGFMA